MVAEMSGGKRTVLISRPSRQPAILGTTDQVPCYFAAPPAVTAPEPSTPPRPLLQELQERFSVFRDCQPLAIGIDKAILARLPDLDRAALRNALRQHTAATRYLKVLQHATQRVDLDGQPAGEVTEAQRAHAAETLKTRFRKAAQTRKEQVEAAATAARQQHKLSELVAKFAK
jgi:ProP effector